MKKSCLKIKWRCNIIFGFSKGHKVYFAQFYNFIKRESGICYLMFAFREKIPIEVEVSSNNKELGQLFNQMILSMFLISSREASGLFLCKIVLNFICGNSAKISSLDGGRIRTNRIF